MNEQFIESRMLEFHKDLWGPGDSIWAGMDVQGDQEYELFFEAGGDGPTNEQIRAYEAFVAQIEPVTGVMTDRVRSELQAAHPELYEKTLWRSLEIAIVNVNGPSSASALEVCCTLKYKKFIFTKRIYISVHLTDNRVSTVEIH